MFRILFLLIFQSFCTAQILGSDLCNHSERFDSYLDIAVDLITKAKLYFPGGSTTTQKKTSTAIECEKALQRCQNHSIISPTATEANIISQTATEENIISPTTPQESIISPTTPLEKTCRPMDCEELLSSGHKHSGVYTIWPRNRLTYGKPLEVYCDMDTDDGGWTVIQRRGNFNKSRLFFWQDWSNYKNGFGDIKEDFWLGNDNIFALSNQRNYSILFDLKSMTGEKRHALYDIFWIDDEDRKYTLHIRNYSGDAGDSMIKQHANQKFSTKDQDNDGAEDMNSPQLFKGGWWYGTNQYGANLNGRNRRAQPSIDGIFWMTFTGLSDSLDTSEMKIRPRIFNEK